MLSREFNEVTGSGWTTKGLNVQYKLIGETLYVQCTRGFSDWMFNLFAAKVEYDEHGTLVTAHAGFASLWLSIRPEIENLEFSKMVLYSQGSAIGTAIHFNYWKRFGYEPESIAFGPPRFFSKKSHSDVNNCFTKFKRVKNKRDVVTHVPFGMMGFVHVGKEILLPKVKFRERPKGARGIVQWLLGHAPSIYRLSTKKYDLLQKIVIRNCEEGV